MSDSAYGGWPTPAARDYRDLSNSGKAYAAARHRHHPSAITDSYLRGFSSSQAPILYSRLMGYPDQWVLCAASAMQSSRKLRANLSARG